VCVCVCVCVLSRPACCSEVGASSPRQPSFLAALDAGGRLRNNALAADGRCMREQRTWIWTYLTLLLSSAALQTGGVQLCMQLCERACRNWTLARTACNSQMLLRR
jgi:hypothetical protein